MKKTLKTQSFTEEIYTLVDLFIQGLVSSHVGIEWMYFNYNILCIYFKYTFTELCQHGTDYHGKVCYKSRGEIFELLNFVARDDCINIKGSVSVYSIFLKKENSDVLKSVVFQAI